MKLASPLRTLAALLLLLGGAACSSSGSSKPAGGSPGASASTAAGLSSPSTSGASAAPQSSAGQTPALPASGSLSPTSGKNDLSVTLTISGTGLRTTQGVQLNTPAPTPLVFQAVSDSELRATVPAAAPAGDWTLQVTDATGTALSAGTYRVENLADPDLPGSFQVGIFDTSFTGASGDPVDARITYPASSAGANSAPDRSAAPYPVIVYSHGFRPPIFSFGIGHQSNAFVAEWLSAFGYVVICPDMSTNNDLFGTGQENSQRDALDILAALDVLEGVTRDPNHLLFQQLDLTRVGLAGHSRGGDASLLAGAQELQARGAATRVLAIAALSPPAFDAQNNSAPFRFGNFSPLPLLLISADQDRIAPTSDQRAIFAQAGSPSMLYEMAGGNHSQYTDSGTHLTSDGQASLPLSEQQGRVQRYLTAWFGTHVKTQASLFTSYVQQGSKVLADPHLASLDTR